MIIHPPASNTHPATAPLSLALMLIFKSLGMRCVPYLDQIVPHVIVTLRASGPGLRDSLLLQLSQLASIIKYVYTCTARADPSQNKIKILKQQCSELFSLTANPPFSHVGDPHSRANLHPT